MGIRRDLQTASAWEAELNKERAGALGLTARRLEAELEKCAALRAEWRGANPARRAVLEGEHEAARVESERLRWNLCVQREAMGLRRHDDVDLLYPPAPQLRGSKAEAD
jgi:hypothetical protein